MTYTEPDPTQEPSALRQAVDTANATARDATTRAETAERELAMVRAGIDTTTPLGTMFAGSYAGELTVDAIRAAATEVGAYKAETTPPPATGETTPPPPAAPPGTPPGAVILEPGEAGMTDLRQNLAAGATGDNAQPPPQKPAADRAVEIGKKIINDGGTLEDGAAATFGALVGAAAGGDESVILGRGGLAQQ